MRMMMRMMMMMMVIIIIACSLSCILLRSNYDYIESN
jgi:hypothetical protein